MARAKPPTPPEEEGPSPIVAALRFMDATRTIGTAQPYGKKVRIVCDPDLVCDLADAYTARTANGDPYVGFDHGDLGGDAA